MIRSIVASLVFITMHSPAHADKIHLDEGIWTGSLAYTNGTTHTAEYYFTVDDNNETELRILDEDEIDYYFKPVSVKNDTVSFLWNAKKKGSKCTLTMHPDTDFYQGKCRAFQDVSITITMFPPDENGDSEETGAETKTGKLKPTINANKQAAE